MKACIVPQLLHQVFSIVTTSIFLVMSWVQPPIDKCAAVLGDVKYGGLIITGLRLTLRRAAQASLLAEMALVRTHFPEQKIVDSLSALVCELFHVFVGWF